MAQILRPFVNTLTPDEKYFLCKRQRLPQPIQMQLSKKLKIFSQFATGFLEATFNYKLFKKIYESHS